MGSAGWPPQLDAFPYTRSPLTLDSRNERGVRPAEDSPSPSAPPHPTMSADSAVPPGVQPMASSTGRPSSSTRSAKRWSSNCSLRTRQPRGARSRRFRVSLRTTTSNPIRLLRAREGEDGDRRAPDRRSLRAHPRPRPDECLCDPASSGSAAALATSRCRNVCSFAAGDARVAIVGLERRDDRFGPMGAR